MRTPEALINPELLIWARESANYDVATAAARLDVDVERLTAWENGESHPSIAQLRRASEVYRRPLAAFFLPNPPKDFHVPRDFRRAVDSHTRKMPPELVIAFRRVQFQREVAASLAESPPSPTFQGTATINSPIEKLAQIARESLGITIAEQTTWRDPYTAFNRWRSSLESQGILVVQVEQVDVSDFRGFSIQAPLFPVIALNSKDHPHGKIFTCLHEYCHLLLNSDAVCDLTEDDQLSPEDVRTEQFCNAFAGSMLVPRTELLSRQVVVRLGRRNAYPDEAIEELATTFSVSREVIVRRLLTCDLVPHDFYLRKRSEYLAQIQQQSEESESGGFISFPMRVFRKSGPEFTRIVLDAYDRQVITGADVSAYLDTRIKHLEPLRKLAFSSNHFVETE